MKHTSLPTHDGVDHFQAVATIKMTFLCLKLIFLWQWNKTLIMTRVSQQTCIPLSPLGKPTNSTTPLIIGWPGSPGKPMSPWMRWPRKKELFTPTKRGKKQPQLLERLGEERADCGLEDGRHEAAQEAAEESADRGEERGALWMRMKRGWCLLFLYNFNPTYRNFEGGSDSNSQIQF